MKLKVSILALLCRLTRSLHIVKVLILSCLFARMEFMHYLSGAALASELIAKPEGAHTNSVSTHLVATTTMVVVPYVYESTRGLNGYSRLHMAR